MIFDKQGNLIFGIGDQHYDGVRGNANGPQDEKSSYGKLIKINLATLKTELIAKGVRNPQGLLMDRDGRIWETEHGPEGGDELNLVVDGADYGWPSVTYGSDDNAYEWPLNKKQGRHDDFQRPVFSWVPSIGTSNLIEVRDVPPQWDGDLLVASLKAGTLFRMRIHHGSVKFVEPINVGRRIRDLLQLDDGTILLWTDTASLVELTAIPSDERGVRSLAVELTADEEAAGLRQIIASCGVCHGLNPGTSSANGPSLWGVYQREIAGTNFVGYSTALRTIGGTWTDASLSAFLLDPQRFAPGTSMPDPYIEDSRTAAALGGYLRRLN